MEPYGAEAAAYNIWASSIGGCELTRWPLKTISGTSGDPEGENTFYTWWFRDVMWTNGMDEPAIHSTTFQVKQANLWEDCGKIH